MEENFGQKLTEEEAKSYTPNRNLQLSLSCEIKRLRKVIFEKNAQIEKFKKYDAGRKSYCKRLEQDCALMEERFAEMERAVSGCDDFEFGTKAFVGSLFSNLGDSAFGKDAAAKILLATVKSLFALGECLADMKTAVKDIKDPQDRKAVSGVFDRLRRRFGGIVNMYGDCEKLM